MTETRPLVSVIIPTYNGERWLSESARSVLAQTYPHLELIIVDDGSADGTKEIIESLCRRDQRVRAVYKANGGAASARNAGIAATRGEYVALLDQDDVFLPMKLEQQVRFLNEHPEAEMVYGRFLVVDGQGKVLREQPIPPRTSFRELWEACSINFCSILIRKRVLEEVGPLNERIGWADDLDVLLRIARRGHIAFLNDLVAHYRWHGANTSAVADERSFYRFTLQVLYAVGSVPEEGVTASMFRRRVSRFHYCLARLECGQGAIIDARRHFWLALRHNPAVGLLFRTSSTNAVQAIWLLLKPYAALAQSTLREIVTAMRLAKPVGAASHAHRD